jgi:uncharacterized protein (TIGR00369 family)
MSYLNEIERRGKEANPFFCLMDIEPVSWGDGKARLEMKVRRDMTNGEGWLQGGVYTSLIDEAMALAIYTLLDEHEMIATISSTTHFLRGAKADTLIAAEALVTRRGRQIVFTEGRAYTVEDGRDLARCSASFAVRQS